MPLDYLPMQQQAMKLNRLGAGAATAHAPEQQKFFGSFFQKRTASS
jgi:hypothetical protein